MVASVTNVCQTIGTSPQRAAPTVIVPRPALLSRILADSRAMPQLAIVHASQALKANSVMNVTADGFWSSTRDAISVTLVLTLFSMTLSFYSVLPEELRTVIKTRV